MNDRYSFWLAIALMVIIAIVTIYLIWMYKDVITWDTEIPFT